MEIAIAGAGIAGLTAAIALAGRGFSLTLYERADALADIGAGIQLAPNAMTALPMAICPTPSVLWKCGTTWSAIKFSFAVGRMKPAEP